MEAATVRWCDNVELPKYVNVKCWMNPKEQSKYANSTQKKIVMPCKDNAKMKKNKCFSLFKNCKAGFSTSWNKIQ